MLDLIAAAAGALVGVAWGIRRHHAAAIGRARLAMLDADDLLRLQLGEQAGARRELQRLM